MNIFQKRFLFSFIAAGMVFSTFASGLPRKEILGKEYYVYTSKGGDSLYGIARKYGWDEKELIRLNPELSGGLKKGMTLYYPTGNVTVVEIQPSESAPVIPEVLEPIRHTVRRGQTVYGIASMYGIPVETLYRLHPSARKGIKAGETIVIDQHEAGFATDEYPWFYITVNPGNTLYGLAKQYNTSIEALLKSNPGLSEHTLRSGEMIRVPVADTVPRVVRTTVNEEQLASLSTYKVEKNDTWSSIAAKTGASVESLKEANSGVSTLKKNELLAVPEMEVVEVEKDVEYYDPREKDSSGRKEIYDSIHHLPEDDITNVRLALLLNDPSTRRDIEFSRGVLLALRQMGNPGYKVDMKIIPGTLALDSVISTLDRFNPQVVIDSSDKAISDWLIDYGSRTGVESINVFDANTETYTSAPNVIQLLTPSNYFYDAVGKALADEYGSRMLYTVTKGTDSDSMADAIASFFPSSGDRTRIMLENLNPSLLPSSGSILIYADLSEKEDIEKLFSTLSKVKEQSPRLDVTIVGRPKWVMWGDSMREQFYENDVVIPSRFFFDHESEDGKAFIEAFTKEFGRGPLKSYPNYAASGYDLINYIVPALALNEGDFNVRVPDSDTIQSPLALERVSNWGGFFNPRCMLVHFTPTRIIDRLVLK